MEIRRGEKKTARLPLIEDERNLATAATAALSRVQQNGTPALEPKQFWTQCLGEKVHQEVFVGGQRSGQFK